MHKFERFFTQNFGSAAIFGCFERFFIQITMLGRLCSGICTTFRTNSCSCHQTCSCLYDVSYKVRSKVDASLGANYSCKELFHQANVLAIETATSLKSMIVGRSSQERNSAYSGEKQDKDRMHAVPHKHHPGDRHDEQPCNPLRVPARALQRADAKPIDGIQD